MTTLNYQSPRHRVLVVEDEEESGLLVEASLKAYESGIEIEWVTTAEEAERILKTDSGYDLIVADHFLEGRETGLDLWRVCHDSYGEIPFVMTSALDPEVFSILTADDLNQPVFLHKPFRPSDCKELLEDFWEVSFPKPELSVPAKTKWNLDSTFRLLTFMLFVSIAAISVYAISGLEFFNTNAMRIIYDGIVP